MANKGNFTITEEHDQKLSEIKKAYGLSKSDSVRRAIDMLHDYLMKDTQPEDSKAGKVEKKADEAKG
jgi:hypothetical protein